MEAMKRAYDDAVLMVRMYERDIALYTATGEHSRVKYCQERLAKYKLAVANLQQCISAEGL